MKKSQNKGLLGKLIFYFSGIFATIWVLIRVIQKPSRINYPCIQTSIPLMVSFITYLSGVTIIAVFVRFFKTYIGRKKYMLAGITVFAFVAGLLLVNTSMVEDAFARKFKFTATYTSNNPVGVEKGFIPGRVVWVHDKAATNESTTNTEGDYWFMNTNQEAVDNMLDKGVKKLVEKNTIKQAWNAIFRYFNFNQGKGAIGYTNGEKIFIKLNFTNSCCCFPNRSTTEKNGRFDKMDSTPEVVVAILRHLVDSVGIEPENITVGDPFRRFPDSYYNIIHDAYPGVIYMDDAGINGRTQVTITSTPPLIFSDHETGYEANIPQAYMDAAYFINLPCLKTHDAGGITLAAKNHQGSIMEKGKTTTEKQSAYFMHYCLPGDNRGKDLNSYRHLVDYMGHEKLGGNTLIYIVDAVWSGLNWEGNLTKWDMAPFNGDYPNSLFLSQDPVAIESVGFDFLYNEFGDDSNDGFPAIPGAIEFLEQAADPANWPTGITYDPENDGTPLQSLGVYEHWNNATDKQYSRNLGASKGIELVPVFDDFSIDISGVDTFLFDSQQTFTLNIFAQNGSVDVHPNQNEYEAETDVELTPVPNENYKFENWSGDLISSSSPITITMRSNKEITANFVLKELYTISTSSINGSITLNPPGEEYYEGTEVTVTAVPDEGYEFSGWISNYGLDDAFDEQTITINKNININAQFTPITGISYPKNSSKLIVYPIPLGKRDNLHVRLNEDTSNNLLVKIYDIAGKCIVDKEFNSTEFKLNLSRVDNLKVGTYILEIVNGEKSYRAKFVVK